MTLTRDAKRKNQSLFLHRILQGGAKGKRQKAKGGVFWQGFVLFFSGVHVPACWVRRLQGRKSCTRPLCYCRKVFFSSPPRIDFELQHGQAGPPAAAAVAVGQPRGRLVVRACPSPGMQGSCPAWSRQWHGLWPSVQSALPTVCVTPAWYIGSLSDISLHSCTLGTWSMFINTSSTWYVSFFLPSNELASFQ